MKKLFGCFFSGLNFNRIIIFSFLVIYVGFYFPDYQKIITLSYLMLALWLLYNFIKYKRIKFFTISIVSLPFLLFSTLSILWAPNMSASLTEVITLTKSILIPVLFVNLIKEEKDFHVAFFSLFLGGLIYAIIYMNNVDITMLGSDRISTTEENDELPNVNTVGLILSFSFAYFMFMFFKIKNIFFLIGSLISCTIIVVLGARKTLISLFISVLLLFAKLENKYRIWILLLLAVFVFVVVLIVPIEYLEFVFGRMGELANQSENQMTSNSESDDLRVNLIIKGIAYFIQSPILGNGYYSFSKLYGDDTGYYVYSHNNFIETLVGGGLIAFYLYYLIYFLIIKRLFIHKLEYDFRFLILILVVVLLFNHLSIVVLQERFIWLLLSLMWVGTCYSKNKNSI